MNNATHNTESDVVITVSILPDVMSNNNAYNVAKMLNTGSLNLEPDVMTENSAYNMGEIKNGSLNLDDSILMEPDLMIENSAYNVRESDDFIKENCMPILPRIILSRHRNTKTQCWVRFVGWTKGVSTLRVEGMQLA